MTSIASGARGLRSSVAVALAAFLVTASVAAPRPAAAQPRPAARTLALDEALGLAHRTSEALDAAGAAVDAAAGRRTAVGSLRLPSVAAYSSFDRALRSEFDGLSLGEPDPGAEPAPDLPFGSPNTYRTGLSIAQTVLSGGRTQARVRAAASAERAAGLALVGARARLTLQVAEAYYDAQLGGQLVAILRETLAQADSTARRAAVVLQAGRGSEFELLRARVARDRQRPALIRQEEASAVAMLRLRQLVHLAPDAELVLTTPLEPGPAAPAAIAVAPSSPPGRDPAEPTATAPPLGARRAIVREAAELLAEREQLAAAARAARWPTLGLTSTYERVAYRRDGVPGRGDFRTNWTAGARVDVPLFTGGQRAGSEAAARADADAARATLRRTEQLADLDARAAAAQLAAADAAWWASEGGVQEAARAYAIAMLRHREGLAIQLELTDARLALESARSERARAARDLLVERLRTSLLADLPLTTAAAR